MAVSRVVGERGPSVCRRAPSNTEGSTAIKHYAAIDVSLELSSVCIIDATAKVVKESKVVTHPDALVKLFKNLGVPLTLIGLEAGPRSPVAACRPYRSGV